jgi:hypothetical protein
VPVGDCYVFVQGTMETSLAAVATTAIVSPGIGISGSAVPFIVITSRLVTSVTFYAMVAGVTTTVRTIGSV